MKKTAMELTELIEKFTKKIEAPKQNSNCNYVPQILNNLIKKDYYNDIDIFYIEKLSFNPHCASTRGNACIHKAIWLSEFLFVYYRFYFGEGSLLDAKGVNNCFNFCSGREHFFTDISCSTLL